LPEPSGVVYFAAVAAPARALVLLTAILAAACATGSNDDDVPVDGPPGVDANHPVDASHPADASHPIDAGPPADAASHIDASGPVDAAAADAGSSGTGDTCAEAIDLTDGATHPGGTTDSRYSGDYSNYLEPPSSCTNGYGEDGPDVIYYVVASAGDSLYVVLTPYDYDGAVYILSDCSDPSSCVGGSDSGYSGDPEIVDYTIPSPGTYYIVADSYLPDEFGDFTISVTLN